MFGVYAPIMTHTDDVKEALYEDLNRAIREKT